MGIKPISDDGKVSTAYLIINYIFRLIIAWIAVFFIIVTLCQLLIAFHVEFEENLLQLLVLSGPVVWVLLIVIAAWLSKPDWGIFFLFMAVMSAVGFNIPRFDFFTRWANVAVWLLVSVCVCIIVWDHVRKSLLQQTIEQAFRISRTKQAEETAAVETQTE